MIMTKLRAFLIGILLGQGLMVGFNHFYPNIKVELVPLDVFQRSVPVVESAEMYKVPDWDGKKRTLTINITDPETIRKMNLIQYPDDDSDRSRLMGYYNPELHEIWTPRDVRILIHELRHVFEGYYHK